MIAPLPTHWVDRYLERLKLENPRFANFASLRSMHLAHLREIPFECLDVQRGVPLSLDADALCEKVLTRGRGGFCYELNSLFARLLLSLGYRVDLLAARVVDSEGELGPPFDHMALRVTGDEAEPFLCDVGFGRSFLEPLHLRQAEQEDAAGRFRLRDAEHPQLWLDHFDSGQWSPSYRLDPTPRRLDEFTQMFRYHQSDAASPFPRTYLISRATERGRITVRDFQVTQTENGAKRKWELANEAQRAEFVVEHFGEAFVS